MSDVTRLLDAIGRGEPQRARELLPLVYEELRKLAAARLAREPAGQTLQATALVHEAYLRLVGEGDGRSWENRGHFFAAAAEAMRRLLIEGARRKQARKRGGDVAPPRLRPGADRRAGGPGRPPRSRRIPPTARGPRAAQAALVKLRYFAGLTIPQAAEALGIAPRTADAYWSYARAWLLADLRDEPE